MFPAYRFEIIKDGIAVTIPLQLTVPVNYARDLL